VVKTINHTQNTTFYKAPDGYDRDHYDDVHSCDGAAKPAVISVSASAAAGGNFEIVANISRGNSSHSDVTSVTFRVDGVSYQGSASSATTWSVIVPKPAGLVGDSAFIPVEITVVDAAFYSVPSSESVRFTRPTP
jgi:hypothetical protein